MEWYDVKQVTIKVESVDQYPAHWVPTPDGFVVLNCGPESQAP